MLFTHVCVDVHVCVCVLRTLHITYHVDRPTDVLHHTYPNNQIQGAQAMLVSALDEVAWLLNVRGGDVEFNPVIISYVGTFVRTLAVLVRCRYICVYMYV